MGVLKVSTVRRRTTVVARVREGAPFAMRAALSAVNGTLSPVTALVPAGMTTGTPIAVTQAAAGATRVIVAAAAMPDTRCGVLGTYRCFQGITTTAVDGDTLTLASNEDGREGTVTITVTATDDDGLTVTLTFAVTVESMPRGLLRGWRRVLLEQAMERQATEVE